MYNVESFFKNTQNSLVSPIIIYTNTVHEKVLVTPSGTKFHLPDCRYTKDKECITLTVQEAKEKYSPCSVCRP